MKKVLILLLSASLLFITACRNETEKPDLDIAPPATETPSPSPVNIPSELPEVITTTEAFSYVEYKPRDGVTPYFSQEYGCSDNLIMCRFDDNGKIGYGFMDLTFKPICGPVSDKPTIFQNGYSMLTKDNERTLVDSDFREVETYRSKWFIHDGQLVEIDPVQMVYTFDFTKYMDMDPSEVLVPINTDKDPYTGETLESWMTGYKTFEDLFISKVEISEAWAIDPVFRYASFFNQWYAEYKFNGLFGCIDNTGNVIIDAKYSEIRPLNNNFMMAGKTYSDGNKENPYIYCLMDTDGNEITGYDYIWIDAYESGYLRGILSSYEVVFFSPEGRMIDMQGKVVDDFKNDLLLVHDEEGFSYIDKSGKQVFGVHYDSAYSFSDGYAAVANMDSGWGYIDVSGNFVIEQKYSEAGNFDSGYALVRDGSSRGLIDIYGVMHLEDLEITKISLFNEDGYALAYSEYRNMYYVIHMNNMDD